MINSRAKEHRVRKTIECLDGADAMICNATLCNVLHGKQEDFLMGLLQSLRRFRTDLERAADAKFPDKPKERKA